MQNIDNIVAQWEGQWNKWYSEAVSNAEIEVSTIASEMQSKFDIWFADVKALLEDDVATQLASQVAALQGKFDDLAREGAVYDTIEDSNIEVLLGSDGTPIQGKVILGIPGSGGSSSSSANRSTLVAVLPAGGWGDSAPYKQTAYVSGITKNDTPHVSLIVSDDVETGLAQEESYAMITRGITADESIVFMCYQDKPEVTLTLQIEVIK